MAKTVRYSEHCRSWEEAMKRLNEILLSNGPSEEEKIYGGAECRSNGYWEPYVILAS